MHLQIFYQKNTICPNRQKRLRCLAQRFLFLFYVFLYTRVFEPDQIFHSQSMVANRGRANRANVHIDLCE